MFVYMSASSFFPFVCVCVCARARQQLHNNTIKSIKTETSPEVVYKGHLIQFQGLLQPAAELIAIMKGDSFWLCPHHFAKAYHNRQMPDINYTIQVNRKLSHNNKIQPSPYSIKCTQSTCPCSFLIPLPETNKKHVTGQTDYLTLTMPSELLQLL